MTAFCIWSIAAIVFFCVGIYSEKSEKAVSFFTFENPIKVTDVTGFNGAVAKLWFTFAAGFEILGVPFLFVDSPLVLLVILGVIALVIALIAGYLKIENKYAEKK